MSGIGITIRDELSPILQRVQSAAQARGLALVGARAVGQLVRDHLVKLNEERHKAGGRNYYAQAAQSVTTSEVNQGAVVSITQMGIRQRFYGGPIDPKNAKYLTIPASPEAYEHRAGEFADLHFAYAYDEELKVMRPALIRNLSSPISPRRRKNADGTVKFHVTPNEIVQGGEVMFWLVKHVEQKPDPTVLPEQREIAHTALDAMQKRLERLQSRQGGEN